MRHFLLIILALLAAFLSPARLASAGSGGMISLPSGSNRATPVNTAYNESSATWAYDLDILAGTIGPRAAQIIAIPANSDYDLVPVSSFRASSPLCAPLSKYGKSLAAKSGEGLTTLFHGSDVASVESMVATGIDKEAARALGGGDVFWVTKEKDIATWFAQANLKGGLPAVAAFKLPTSTLQSMVRSGAVEIDRTGAYMIKNWDKFNKAVIQRSVE